MMRSFTVEIDQNKTNSKQFDLNSCGRNGMAYTVAVEVLPTKRYGYNDETADVAMIVPITSRWEPQHCYVMLSAEAMDELCKKWLEMRGKA